MTLAKEAALDGEQTVLFTLIMQYHSGNYHNALVSIHVVLLKMYMAGRKDKVPM